jgi:hypothetical protein
MSRLRIGKDFAVKWNIYKREEDIREAYDLTGKDILFEYSTPYGRKRIENFKVAGNTIEWTFLGKDQVYLGSYTLYVTENPGKEGMITVDSCKAFVLVRHTCEEELEENENITIQTIELESDVILAPSVVYVGGGDIKVDSTLSTTSTNAIQNKAVTNALNKKQDIITDLATIRAGAEKGSTALQEEQFKGTYSKPNGGIPKSDLASAVQSSLNKADTALQTETYKGTVTGVKMNGQTKGTSGIVDLGTVLTQHQDLSGKQDKLVSGTNIKTINGKSLLGSGNLIIEGGSGGSADLTGYATEIWVEGKGYALQSDVDEDLATKQDKITDLATIRSGAAKGATSVQNTEIAKVAKSGSYNDLTNKPTIPAAVTETTVKGWGFTKNTGTYSKPSGGIPKTDLAPAVQTSLDSVESKQNKPIVFDAVAIGYDVNVAETEITAEQIQTATGMTSEELYDAVIAGRKVTLSLGEFYGSYELLAIQDFNDFAYLVFGFATLLFSVIIIRGGGGSIQQSAPFDDYYTKNDVDEKIASAITSTLNTAV